MAKLVVIDGNSILNRAFYGIMGSKMLTTKDGTYTNAVYGFLAIMFKMLEDIQPEYMVVAFDVKSPTKRHKMYEGYKATRRGMPDELSAQMPILKEILEAMKIKIIEKEGYEADDVLGTLAKFGEEKEMEVTIISGDRDTFQLASKKTTIHIPRTKMGKTELDLFDEEKVKEIYGLKPKQLIDVKGLQGDTSDNIPGVPGIGEKTALTLVQKYGSIEKLYEEIEKGTAEVKGKAKENLVEYKDQAFMSKELGTIDTDAPIEKDLELFRVEPWDRSAVYHIFKELNFNRFIERFHLEEEKEAVEAKDLFQRIEKTEEELLSILQNTKKLFYCFQTMPDQNQDKIILKAIKRMAIYEAEKKEVYEIEPTEDFLKQVFEEKTILKYGYHLAEDYILLKQIGIEPASFVYDAEIAAYDLNPTNNKYALEILAEEYLQINLEEQLESMGLKQTESQMNLFETTEEGKEEEYEKQKLALFAWTVGNLYEITKQKLKENGEEELFETIEMPLVEVLAEMQYKGMMVDRQELEAFGQELRERLEQITKEIYKLTGEEFNINSPKQLGEILFEKLKLPVYKKTKSGYSTDVDVLEKLRSEHPVVEKILEYRSLSKLNSTYVEGLILYIHPKTQRIHSYFHQTITATGRISSTDPNLQNIPTRIELGKRLRKVFKPAPGYIYIDADYSQIELRVLAHISRDRMMLKAFRNDEDIHKQVAAKVMEIPMEEVTKEQRTHAKAVNFGIVYGISDFGLAGQLGISKKKAKDYITQYLEKYSGIKKFMEEIVEKAKEEGYVETLFHRRRYIPELKSNSYLVRQFGERAAMNTPIQGTAADIMKIAMIHVQEELNKRNLESKVVLQVHDELLIEAKIEEKEVVKEILRDCMENAISLKIPLKVEMSEAENWYEAK